MAIHDVHVPYWGRGELANGCGVSVKGSGGWACNCFERRRVAQAVRAAVAAGKQVKPGARPVLGPVGDMQKLQPF